MPFVINVYGISEDDVFMKCMLLLFLTAMQFYHVFVLKGIQRSVFRLRQPNITNIDFGMHEYISYEDCRCNIISIESCLDDLHFKYTRTLPLILFVLEVHILKDLLSLSRYRRYFIINFYWIISTFLFFCLVMIIYQSSYYYITINILLSELGIVIYLCCSISKFFP